MATHLATRLLKYSTASAMQHNALQRMGSVCSNAICGAFGSIFVLFLDSRWVDALCVGRRKKGFSSAGVGCLVKMRAFIANKVWRIIKNKLSCVLIISVQQQPSQEKSAAHRHTFTHIFIYRTLLDVVSYEMKARCRLVALWRCCGALPAEWWTCCNSHTCKWLVQPFFVQLLCLFYLSQ